MLRSLAKIFSIRQGEEKKTLLLLLIYFFFYVGLRWGENASETLFISSWGAGSLSFTFIANSILSFTMAFLFTYLADRISNERLLIGMVGMMIVWLVSVRLLLVGATSGQELVYPYFYLFYLTFGDMATLNILNYITDFYDTRSAKRTLPLMMSGATAGTIFAGLTAPLLNQLFDLSNVPIAWMVCLVVVIILIVIVRHELATEIAAMQKAKPAGKSAGGMEGVLGGFKFLRESGLLRWMVVATFTVTLLMRLLQFLSSQVFAAEFRGDPQGLFNFYGILSGLANILGIILQSLILGRLISRFGVKVVNLVFPVLTFLSTGLVSIVPGLATAIFGRLDYTMLKQAFRVPLDAIMSNAMPLEIKGRARGLLKLVFPMGSLVVGLLLIAVQAGYVPLNVLGLLGIVIGIFYLITSIAVTREYTRALIRMLAEDAMSMFRSARDTSQEEFEQPDPATLAMLHKRLEESDNDELTIFMAEMINEIEGRNAIPRLQSLYQARGPKVRTSIIQMLGEDWMNDSDVRQLCLGALRETDTSVRHAAINALAHDSDIARDSVALGSFAALLQSPDENTRAQVIPILLASNNREYVNAARHQIDQWLAAELGQQRALGLRVLSHSGDEDLLQHLAQYEQDPTPSVRYQAASLLGELLRRAKNPQVQKQTVQSLQTMLKDTDESVRLATVQGIGQLSNAESDHILLTMIKDDSFAVRREVCSLVQAGSRSELERVIESNDPNEAECAAYLLTRSQNARASRRIIEWMEELVGDVYTLHAQRLALDGFDSTGARLLKATMNEQATQLLDRVFWLMSAFSSEAEIKTIRWGLQSSIASTHANAVETVESMTSPRLASLIAPLFDGTPLPKLVEFGQQTLNIQAPTQWEIFCQVWPQLYQQADLVLDPHLAALNRDGWLASTAMYALVELDTRKLDGIPDTSIEQVRKALQITLDQGTMLEQETARRILPILSPAPESETGEKTMLTAIEKVIFLKEVTFFQDMTIDQLRILAGISEETDYEANAKIFSEGEYSDALYVVVTGKVAIQRTVKRAGSRASVSISRLSTYGPKEYFAETSFFASEPHSVDAVALEPAHLLAIRQAPFSAIIRQYPEVALSLLKVFSQRLRQANDKLAEKTQAKPKELVDLYDKF
jgi:CRP-like cAMP-binding protein/HEAT repeat protein/MFS family permease